MFNIFRLGQPQARKEAHIHCHVPQWYYVDIGNVCNLKCPYCPTGNGAIPVGERGLMSRESFDMILEKIAPYAEIVSLFNWGEPFMNKNLLYMISEVSRRGVKTHLDSNLSLRDLSDKDAEAVVNSGLSSLFASIDGVSQEAYEKYRVRGNVDRALENLSQLVRAKKRLGAKEPGLLWCFYLNTYNEHEIERAREMAAKIGVKIWYKQLSCPQDFQTSYVKGDGHIFKPPLLARKMPPPQVNSFVSPFKLHSALPAVCRQPFTVGVINWDGSVTPCCAVAGKEYSLGNLLEQDLDEIWNGSKMIACREFLSNFGPVQCGGSVCESVCKAVPSHI